MVAKGILSAEDARLAVNSGVSAVQVSNHGGRVLDGADIPVSKGLIICCEKGASCQLRPYGDVRPKVVWASAL